MELNVAYALLMTLGAGLATGVGSAIALFAKTTSRKFLSFSLGFSAGVMIYVSFMELLFQARIELSAIEGDMQGNIITVLSFFGGVVLAALIDKMVPAFENPHEPKSIEDLSSPSCKEKKLARMGVFAAFAIAIHNFPEGIATFISAVEHPEIGIAIATAIAIHNIPEGIAVSVPIYYATGSRKKAFWYSFMSGLAEPVGAVLAWLVLMPFMTPALLYGTFAAVSGIMVYISLDELLPASREYGHHHASIYGLIGGMAIMAFGLILIK